MKIKPQWWRIGLEYFIWTSICPLSQNSSIFWTSIAILNQYNSIYWTSVPIISRSRAYYWTSRSIFLLKKSIYGYPRIGMISKKTRAEEWCNLTAVSRRDLSMRPIQGRKLKLFQGRVSGVLCIDIRHRLICFLSPTSISFRKPSCEVCFSLR